MELLGEFAVLIGPVAVELFGSGAVLAVVVHLHVVQLLLVAGADGIDRLAYGGNDGCAGVGPGDGGVAWAALGGEATRGEECSDKAGQLHRGLCSC